MFDLLGLDVCAAAWASLDSKQIESSGAEVPGPSVLPRALPSGRAKTKALEKDLQGLGRLFGDLDTDSDEEEEVELPPKQGQASSSSQAVLPPGTKAKKEKKKDKESFQIGDLVRSGLEQSQRASDLFPLAMLTMIMKQEGGRRRKKEQRNELLGGSSSDSESGTESFQKSGMKAVVSLNRMHQRIHERPSRVCAEFEREVVEELGIVSGQSWTLKDYDRRQPWGKFKGLLRCAQMDVAAYELIRNGEPDAAAAQLAQNLKAKVQAVLQQGDWSAAWLLTGLPDALTRRDFAGTKSEMAIVSGYLDAVGKLKKKVRETTQGNNVDDDEVEDGVARGPKK